MELVIIERDQHYQNPSCKCDHLPTFPERGEPAAPEGLHEELKSGIPLNRLRGPWVDGARTLAGKAAGTWCDHFYVRAPLRSTDGRLRAILSWTANENAYGGHCNDVTYDLYHALVDLPDDVFEAMCAIARRLARKATDVSAAIEEALETNRLDDASVRERRGALLAEHGIEEDEDDHKTRDRVFDAYGLLPRQVELLREEVRRKATVEFNACHRKR